MKRLKVVLAFALALAMMVTISVAPALANNNLDRRDFRIDKKDLQVDRQILHELRDDDFCCRNDFGHHNFGHHNFGFNTFGFNNFDGCWEWSWVFERWEWDCD